MNGEPTVAFTVAASELYFGELSGGGDETCARDNVDENANDSRSYFSA